MSDKFFDTSNLRGDFYGGLTAGVVALPLALAFGEASGAGPIAGVYGAIIVGFFVLFVFAHLLAFQIGPGCRCCRRHYYGDSGVIVDQS